MAYTWELLDIERNQSTHAMTVVFKEIDTVSGEAWHYRITKPDGSTKAEYMIALKAQVLVARALRTKIDNIKAAINPAQIEAFINS